MPGESGVTVVTTLVCFTTLCARGCGCGGHPAFPTPSVGRKIDAQLGRIAPRDRKVASPILQLSSPAKAGDPVFRDASNGIEKPRRTGYPAGACHRARRRRDPVAGYDDLLWSSAELFIGRAFAQLRPASPHAKTSTRHLDRTAGMR